MIVHAYYGLMAQCLIVTAVARLARALWWPKTPSFATLEVVIVSALLLLASVDGISLAEHLRGLWGDPSVTTVGILFAFVLWPRSLPKRPTRRGALVVATVGSALLYLPALSGLTLFGMDPYSLGYSPWAIITALLLASVALWRIVDLVWIRLISYAMLAYGLHILESDNLWDYLVDPGLVIGVVVVAFVTPASQGTARAEPTMASH